MPLDPSHKARLNWRAKEHFSGETLFERIARAVCDAGCLPRKELYEAWEVARRVKRRFRGGRLIDVAAGHGLLAHICALLDRSTTHTICIDPHKPPTATKIAAAMRETWPHLQVEYQAITLQEFHFSPNDVIVSAHACGTLTDDIIHAAIHANAKVAVLPCCHDLKRSHTGPLQGWLDGPLAVDVLRALHLEQAGYQVFTQHIPKNITPKNRLLLATPRPPASG